MKYKLLFFDFVESNINEYKNVIAENNIEFVHTNVVDLINKGGVHIVVSPANSLGFMDGGIDMYYMQLFPGIQKTVQDKIKTFGITSALGRPVLPIGSAMFVQTNSKLCPFLACVPTMFLPENIKGTENVYWATRGLLNLLETIRENANLTVAVPCFGTGVGRMSAHDSATQIKKALHDHENKLNMTQVPLLMVGGRPPQYAYVLQKCACVQSINYANTEIQPDTFFDVVNSH